jgi:hypothetical protein
VRLLVLIVCCKGGGNKGPWFDKVRLWTDAVGDCGNDGETGESNCGIYGRGAATAGRNGGVGSCSLDINVPRVVGRRVSSSSSSSSIQ